MKKATRYLGIFVEADSGVTKATKLGLNMETEVLNNTTVR